MFPTPSKTRILKPFRAPIAHGYKLLFSVLAAGFPAVALCLTLLWTHEYSLDHKLEGTALVLVSWVGLSYSALNSFINPIRVLANVIGSF